jgi:Mg2+ and Co2+ transporter CorA
MGNDEAILKSVYFTLGISPYLLIPSAVLTYNRSILAETDIVISNLLRKEFSNISRKNKILIKVFTNTRSSVENALNVLQLNDVFQYPTEKEIFSKGIQERGITTLNQKIKSRLEELNNKIDEINKKMSRQSEGIIMIFGIVLSIIGLYEILGGIFNMIFKNLFEKNIFCRQYFTGIFVIVLGIISAIIVYRKKIKQTS